jgi:hypothetical protein
MLGYESSVVHPAYWSLGSAAQPVAAADVAVEAPVVAGFRLQSFWLLLGTSH